MSKLRTPAILEEMAETFRERNAIYGDNWEAHSAVMRALFPNGIMLKDEFEVTMYGWVSIMVGKLTRFANAGFKHQDSIHDLAVYGAMCEGYLELATGMGNVAQDSRGTAKRGGGARRAKRTSKKG
jgi:hypothetical protein